MESFIVLVAVLIPLNMVPHGRSELNDKNRDQQIAQNNIKFVATLQHDELSNGGLVLKTHKRHAVRNPVTGEVKTTVAADICPSDWPPWPNFAECPGHFGTQQSPDISKSVNESQHDNFLLNAKHKLQLTGEAIFTHTPFEWQRVRHRIETAELRFELSKQVSSDGTFRANGTENTSNLETNLTAMANAAVHVSRFLNISMEDVILAMAKAYNLTPHLTPPTVCNIYRD